MAPMDEEEKEEWRATVAEGVIEGTVRAHEEVTASHNILPAPASKVGKWFIGIMTSLIVAAIIGAVGIIRWTGTIEATKDAQTEKLKKHDEDIKSLDEKKASKAQLKEQIDVWTAAQKSVLDNIEKNNTQQHQDINGKLDRLLFEVKRSGGGR